MVGGTSIAPRRGRTVLDVAVPGGRIAFTERGSGVPVLFLHGGTGTGSFDWGEIAERLARRGYRTIVPDLRGHGVSPNEEPELGVVRFGLDATHVLRAAGAPRAVHVGFSVGGNSLLALLARDARPALALVTIGASARGDPSRVERIMTGPWPDYLTELDHAVADRPEYWRHLRAQLARDWATNVDLTPGAGARITCPVLVCHGTADRVQPVEYAHHLVAHLPDAELWLAEGAGHAVQLDQPEAFLERLEEFLAAALAPARNAPRSARGDAAASVQQPVASGFAR